MSPEKVARHIASTRRIRTAMVCVSQSTLLCVELEDPATRKRFWSIPGGKIESGETAIKGVVRETLEETGYRVQADAASEVITRYPFLWNGARYECETHWFTGQLASEHPAPVVDDAYLIGYKWIPLTRLPELLAEHPPIKDAVLKLLSQR